MKPLFWLARDARCGAWARRGVMLSLAFVAACGGGAKGPDATTTAAPDTILPVPAESLLVTDPAAASIRRGLALVNATRDSLPAHVGNDLRCASCHLHAGRKALANPLVGASNRYPAHWARTGTTVTLEERINDCFRRSLHGTALPVDGTDMRDIVSYITWISHDVPKTGHIRGLGVDSIAPLPPDTALGKTQFAMYCARCHGKDGQSGTSLGIANPGPPLWGPRSFTIGSGMSRLRIVAAFVHHHMPFDAPGFVKDSMSYNVAGFIVTRPRPDFPGKELDWPNGDAPPDLAYQIKARPKESASPRP